MDEWLPLSKIPAKEEALATLALTYFQSHGPATIHDFCWWSGLTIIEGRKACAINRISAGGRNLLMVRRTICCLRGNRKKTSGQVFLLPNYDEYFVAYKDRSAALDPKLASNIKQLGERNFYVSYCHQWAYGRLLEKKFCERHNYG